MYLEAISQLVYRQSDSAIVAPEHSSLVARLVTPAAGPARDALLKTIAAMAATADVRLDSWPGVTLDRKNDEGVPLGSLDVLT